MVKSQEWWCISVIAALRRPKQEDYKFKSSLGYITRPYLTTKSKEAIACLEK
jgi:hypothetical protein